MFTDRGTSKTQVLVLAMPSRLADCRTDIPSKKRKRTEPEGTSFNKPQPIHKTVSSKRSVAKRLEKVDENEDGDEDEDDYGVATIQAEIMQLEQDIVVSSKNYNCIVKLLEHLEVGPAQAKEFVV